MKKPRILLIVFVIVISCFFGKILVMARAEENGPDLYRYYTNIDIEPGDSLWSIAQEYRINSGMSTEEYIEELKRMNQIHSDQIMAGDSLTIVYFSDSPTECRMP